MFLQKLFFYINVFKYRFLIKKYFLRISKKKILNILLLFKDHDCYGWWEAKLNSVVGFVPKNYLMNAYDVQVK